MSAIPSTPASRSWWTPAVASTASSAVTVAVPSSGTASLDPQRRAALLAVELGALVRAGWGTPAGGGRPVPFPGGAALHDGDRIWIRLDEGFERRLGAALAVALRSGAAEVHLLTDDAGAAGLLARRAAAFGSPALDRPSVHLIRGRSVEETAPADLPVIDAPHPAAMLEGAVLAAAGLDVVVERGEVTGELLGLEVARVVVDAVGDTRIEGGVGRFDREMFAMVHPDLAGVGALERVIAIVSQYRRPDAAPHPLNQLVPERWLRAVLLREPELVGAVELHAAPSAVPRRNLRETLPATAVGTGPGDAPVVVVCSTGVDLELVPAAADDRALHGGDGCRLVLAVPERDALPVISALADALVEPAEILPIGGEWRRGWS